MWEYTSLRPRAGIPCLAIVLVLSTIAVAGCQQERPGCPVEPLPGLAIATGARANSPRPSITPEIEALVQEQIEAKLTGPAEARHGVTIVRVDGRPSIGCVLEFRPTARNAPAQAKEKEDFKAAVRAAVAQFKAKETEANVLGALGMAAAAAGPGGTVALLDSGLQTAPPMDLRQNLLDEEPQDIAKELQRKGHLPDLRNVTVILAGIGYAAPPQESPDQARRDRLVELWSEIVKLSGGNPTVVSTPNTAAAVASVPSVGVIPIPLDTIAIGCGKTSVLSDSGAVGFIPDTASFVNRAKARQTLEKFASWLRAHPKARASLVGTVAHYGKDLGDGGLARERALTVRQELIALGAADAQVSARGDGWGPFPAKNAPPGKDDQKNRRVVISISC